MAQKQDLRRSKKWGRKVAENEGSKKNGPNKNGMNENINRVVVV